MKITRWLLCLSLSLTLSQQGAAIEVAESLIVDLDATSAGAGEASWTNNGSLGHFVEVGDPTFANVGGLVPAVIFDGVDDAYQSPAVAPAGIVGAAPTRTIEAWVFNPSIANEETVVSWGHRGGPDGSNMSFNYGSNGAFGAAGHWGSPDIGWNDAGGAPEALKWHHLVYTHDGTTTRVYSDGTLLNSEDAPLDTHADTLITVAAQLENDGTTITGGLKGSMAISRLRVHDGVLSDTQVMSNYSQEVGAFTNPTLPVPSDPVARPLSSGPIHRYSFSNTAAADAAGGVLEDSVGGANGVVLGEGASFTGSRLSLPGGPSASAAYGDLPNGLVSAHESITIESWLSIDGSQNWQRVFDFGSSEAGELTGPGGEGAGLDYFVLTANRGGNVNQQRVEIRNEDPPGGGISTIDADIETTPPQDIHVAVVIEAGAAIVPGLPEFGTSNSMKYYRDGELVAEGTTNINLSDINDINNWLGRSNWTGDANLQGSYDEFRIYDRALSHDEVLGNIEAGPDVVNIPEPHALGLALLAFVGAYLGLCRRK